MKKHNWFKITTWGLAGLVALFWLAIWILPEFDVTINEKFENFVTIFTGLYAAAVAIGLMVFDKTKEHNALKVVLIAIVLAVLLTWIVPITYFSGELVEEGRNQVGLFMLVSGFTLVIQNFLHVGLYILMVGGFYGVLYKITGYRILLDKIVKKLEGREWLFISISIVLIAVMTAMARMGLAVIFIFPFIIGVILLMGYDKVTAAMVTAGSVAVGLMGTVFSMPILEAQSDLPNQLLTTSVLGESFSEGAGATISWEVKLALLVLGIGLLIFNTLWYAKKHRDKKNVEDSNYLPEATKKKEATWPLIAIMDITLIVIVLAFLSWTNVFEKTWFADITQSVAEFELFKFPIFDKILGGVTAFGTWSLYELSLVLIIASLILSFIYRIKFNDLLKNFGEGMKKAVKPAAVVTLIYLVLVVVVLNPFLLTIVKPILTLTSGFNIFTMSVVAFITSAVGVDLYYAAPLVMEYAIDFVNSAGNHSLMAVIWQSMFGLAMLVAPTSVVLMGTLSYLDIPYGKWLRSIAFTFVLLLALSLVLSVLVLVL